MRFLTGASLILTLTGATSPALGLIDKGEIGIATYGLLFVIVVLSGLLVAMVRNLQARDRLIEQIVERQARAADAQSSANLTLAVAMARIESALDLPPILVEHRLERPLEP
ncbi:MAG: hypothetical protein ABW169_11040 [Sphingobium sp.]